MPALFTLDVETDPAARRAVLRLARHEGPFLAAHEVDLTRHAPADWHGLFDTRRHVRNGVTPPAERLAAIGRFLGHHVLGPEIAGALAEGVDHRTLLVRLPSDPEDRLAAAFARVPWEIAVAPGDDRTLGSRNLVVRAALEGAKPASRETSVAVAPGEAVRVLLVFAEAPGQRPLAARLERERLLDLFFDEVLPTRNVEVDVLCHGVTRRRLEAQVRARGGYHVVHWSGHGHVNALEVAVEEGEKAAPQISGQELVWLFVNAGGFIPSMMFLGACHSGSMVSVKDWDSLRASLGEDDGTRGAGDPTLDRVLEERPGFTGTALALLRAGVDQVVAMRYEVGDAYARDLATRVYRGMFADRAHHAVDAAVALARGELERDGNPAAGYDAVDHATPLVFGSQQVRLVPGAKPSRQVERRRPRPQPLLPSGSRDLDTPVGFVGRGAELTLLLKDWLETDEAPVALIQGLAGLGKTSLAGEAIHLWFERFDYVLAFQARGGAVGVEEYYRRLDQRLTLVSKTYRGRCQENEMVRVYLAPGTEGLTGAEREEALRNNLLDALAYERVLVVLDNFETNLLTKAGTDGAYASGDPAWDKLLGALANRLRGTSSRVMVTSRHKIAAVEGKAVQVSLGPLPLREAALIFQEHAPLKELWYGDDAAKALAKRILSVSRGHPLILGRIADLAKVAGRQAVVAALDKIQGDGYKALPDIFAGIKDAKEREQERRYLEDVAIGAVDLLIERLGKDARTLLWVVTRAGESVTEDMIGAVWAEPCLLLGELCGTGLLVRDDEGAYAFHELVGQRTAAWIELHPEESRGRTETDIWGAYGGWYGLTFWSLAQSGKRDTALEAGRRAIRYLVQARAFENLSGFASAVVNRTNDSALLMPVIADLQAAAGAAPAGKVRWRLLASLADALSSTGRSDQAVPLYAVAAEEAEAAEHWSDVAWICQNWAGALSHLSQFDRAQALFLHSAQASRRAGRSRMQIVGSELEALRVDVVRGRTGAEVLSAIDEKLAEARDWWAKRERDADVPEAGVLVSALDIVRQVQMRLERWDVCLALLDEIERVYQTVGASEHELARVHFRRYGPLLQLGRLAETKAVLEGCLAVFRAAADAPMEANTLSGLAHVWDKLSDPRQAVTLEHAALALHERLPHPGELAISHHNLANYLYTASLGDQAGPHRLAAVAYVAATGSGLHETMRDLAVDARQAAAHGERFDLPRLADILSTPAFAPLRTFLTERAISTADLQARIDTLVEQIRASVASAATAPTPPTEQPPAWPWLPDTLRRAGLTPISTQALPGTPASGAILAAPSEQLQTLFALAPEVLILAAPADVLRRDDIARVEDLYRDNPRIDPTLALAITADPNGQTHLGPSGPDKRFYLCVHADAFRTAPDPQAHLIDLIRKEIVDRRLFDFRLVAHGWQFFGRDKELAQLERDVLAGHCLGVFGLRKVGKSSLVQRLAQKFRADAAADLRVLPIEADLLGASPRRRNLDGLAETIGIATEREVKRAGLRVPATHAHPLERLRSVVAHVEQTHGARVLLILDEYEYLLGALPLAKRDGVELLAWLRGLAQEHPRSFGFMLIGRHREPLAPARIDGIDNPTYRFLRNVHLTGLVPDECGGMIQAIGARVGLRFEPEAIDLIIAETGGHPALARTLADLVDASVPASERAPAVVDVAAVKGVLRRFSREVRYDMQELMHAANDVDPRAGDYLVHLAHGVPWIGGPAEGRIEDALVDYGTLHPDARAFRIGHLLTWLRENYGRPAEAAHG